MTSKLNCWEFKNCGREKGGLMVAVLGECPVPTYMKFDGLNEGLGAGRACWMAPRSPIKSETRQGNCSSRCYRCDFYRRVVFEQEENACFKYTSSRNS